MNDDAIADPEFAVFQRLIYREHNARKERQFHLFPLWFNLDLSL